jgi:hypothetical protein
MMSFRYSLQTEMFMDLERKEYVKRLLFSSAKEH